jgi:hypothetical protein
MELNNNHTVIFVGLDKKINLYETLTGKFKISWDSREEMKGLENHKLTLDCTGSFLAVFN